MIEQTTATQRIREFAPVKVGTPQDVGDRLGELYEMISRRAYQFFEARGYDHGHDLQDWFRAETELLHPVRSKMTHTVNTIRVRAELPGFAADQIQLSVEPRRLIITGKKESAESKKASEGATNERRVEHLFRVIDLPGEIDPSKVVARLQNGVLEINMLKVETPVVHVELKAA